MLMTFYLTQSIIDKSPAGLIITPGNLPERSASILIQLLQKQHTLDGKTVAVLGDTTESAVVNRHDRARAEEGRRARPAPPRSSTSARQRRLHGRARRSSAASWRSGRPRASTRVFLSGDLASTRRSSSRVKKKFPNMQLLADNTDVLGQAQQVQQAGVKPNPYEGTAHRGRPHVDGVRRQRELEVLRRHLQGRDRQGSARTPRTRSRTAQRQDRRHQRRSSTTRARCVTMFADIAKKVGPYLNNTNWVSTVNSLRPDRRTAARVRTRRSTPDKYSADDNWRLQAYDSSLGNTGLWKPITPLAEHSEQLSPRVPLGDTRELGRT